MVASIIAYSLSGSSAKALKRLSQTPFFRPARKPRVDVLPGSKPLRKIPPRRARAELPDHRFDEQAIAHIAVAPNAPGTPRKQSFNPRKLVVTQSIPSHRKPPKMK